MTGEVRDGLRYTKDHEWLRAEADEGVIGISSYAAEELGDIVFVELPAVGARFQKSGTFGVIESVKTASDLYAPVGGEVLAVNDALTASPELVNSDPYGDGWMIRVRLDDATERDALMDAEAYRELIAAG